jgi:hypothetical protein
LGTNLAFLAGILISVVWISPVKFFANFPAFTLISISVICLFWAGEGLFFREEHFEDHRVRNFFILLGVRHPHPYRIVSAWFIAGIVLALVTYWGLYMFPSIFWGIYKSWFIQSTIKFVRSFLQYFPAF